MKVGKCGRGGLQIGIIAWLFFLWIIFGAIDMGECVGHAYMSVACVALTLSFHVLVALHHIDHGSSKVIMRNWMSV